MSQLELSPVSIESRVRVAGWRRACVVGRDDEGRDWLVYGLESVTRKLLPSGGGERWLVREDAVICEIAEVEG